MRQKAIQLILELLFRVCTYLINYILDMILNKLHEVLVNRRK